MDQLFRVLSLAYYSHIFAPPLNSNIPSYAYLKVSTDDNVKDVLVSDSLISVFHGQRFKVGYATDDFNEQILQSLI